jgi:hypothetical protein
VTARQAILELVLYILCYLSIKPRQRSQGLMGWHLTPTKSQQALSCLASPDPCLTGALPNEPVLAAQVCGLCNLQQSSWGILRRSQSLVLVPKPPNQSLKGQVRLLQETVRQRTAMTVDSSSPNSPSGCSHQGLPDG